MFTPQKPGFGTSTLMDGAERIRQTCWMRVEAGINLVEYGSRKDDWLVKLIEDFAL